ncbi:MAG: dihydropteroate synthase [Bacteroidetes bacterium]|nr:dihydropteroate synthase [Bacteroidota bacterium]
MPQDSKKMLNAGGELLDLSTPLVMGILNITPDSFFRGSRFGAYSEELLQRAGEMLESGAAILDVGGYSTRPGAEDIPESEEKDRVLPVVEAILKAFPTAILSIDTFRSGVAREAARSGARMINDVSGGNLDEAMFETVAALKLPYVLMHMRGTPQTMTQLTTYSHLLNDVISELQTKLARLRSLGVADVLIDPGFGFAKTVAQNFELLRNLQYFHELDAPLLIGLSRKSLIWRTLGVSAEEALNGTTVLNTLALTQGAHILRVHDVKEAVEAIKLNEFVARNG